jgi:hypothetical protein
VPRDESLRPLPEPEPPDFDRLPSGCRETFQHRLDRLPIRRIRTGIGAEAILSNESRVLHEYERDHGLAWNLFAPLGAWHMRAVHDRISDARPDLLTPRRPSGVYFGLTTMSRAGRLSRQLPVTMRNLLSGTYTWVRNRAVSARAASLRWTPLQ